MLLINELWSMYEVWATARIATPYTKRSTLRLQTKALIAMDRLS